MIDAFKYALSKTLKWEGGYQANPNDPGNYNQNKELVGTNHGISAPALEEHLMRPVTVEDMKGLSVDVAAEIYRTYWQSIRGDEIRDHRVAALIFDMAVNHGVASAVRLIQRVMGLRPDGRMGPMTISWINGADAEALIKKAVAARIALYERIIARRPAMRVFRRGWLRRAESFIQK